MYNNIANEFRGRGIDPSGFKPTDDLLAAFGVQSRKHWGALIRGEKELTHLQAMNISHWLGIDSISLLPGAAYTPPAFITAQLAPPHSGT